MVRPVACKYKKGEQKKKEDKEKLDTHYICETSSENSYNARVLYARVYWVGNCLDCADCSLYIYTQTPSSAEPCAKNCVTFSEDRLRPRVETVNEV